MPHHYTKTTVEASVWCNRCGKETPWRIADGRRQFCLVCYEKSLGMVGKSGPLGGEVIALESGATNMFRSEKKAAAEPEQQGALFGKELES